MTPAKNPASLQKYMEPLLWTTFCILEKCIKHFYDSIITAEANSSCKMNFFKFSYSSRCYDLSESAVINALIERFAKDLVSTIRRKVFADSYLIFSLAESLFKNVNDPNEYFLRRRWKFFNNQILVLVESRRKWNNQFGKNVWSSDRWSHGVFFFFLRLSR